MFVLIGVLVGVWMQRQEYVCREGVYMEGETVEGLCVCRAQSGVEGQTEVCVQVCARGETDLCVCVERSILSSMQLLLLFASLIIYLVTQMNGFCEVYFPCNVQLLMFFYQFFSPSFLSLSLAAQWSSLYHHIPLIGQRLCLCLFSLLYFYFYSQRCVYLEFDVILRGFTFLFFFAPRYFFFFFCSFEILSLMSPQWVKPCVCTLSSRLPGITKYDF